MHVLKLHVVSKILNFLLDFRIVFHKTSKSTVIIFFFFDLIAPSRLRAAIGRIEINFTALLYVESTTTTTLEC